MHAPSLGHPVQEQGMHKGVHLLRHRELTLRREDMEGNTEFDVRKRTADLQEERETE